MFVHFIAIACSFLAGCLASIGGAQNGTLRRSDVCSSLKVAVPESNVTRLILNRRVRRYWERPVVDASKPVVVNVRLGIQGIQDILEKELTVNIYGYLSMKWQDEFRRWNESDDPALSCVKYIVTPPGRDSGVWLPDFAFLNSRDDKYELTRSNQELVRIYSDGRCAYSPKGTFSFHCVLNLVLFPFDEQTCTLHFESWKYTRDHQILSLFDPPIVLVNFTDNEQWEIADMSARTVTVGYLDQSTVFDAIDFTITFSRKPGYYVITIIVPIIIISLVQTMTFSIPVRKANRLEVSYTLLLAYAVFLVLVEREMPRTATSAPMLSVYVFLNFLYIALAILFQSIGLYFVWKASKAPKATKKDGQQVSNDFPLEDVTVDPSGKAVVKTQSSPAGLTREQWARIIVIFDRCAWCIYLFLVIGTILCCFVFFPAGNGDFYSQHKPEQA